MPVAYKGVRSCRASASGWCWGMYRGVILEFMRREGLRFGAWEREVYAEILFGVFALKRREMRDERCLGFVPGLWVCAVSGCFVQTLARSWLPLRFCLIISSCDSQLQYEIDTSALRVILPSQASLRLHTSYAS